jgi:hypothetical protein
MSIAWSLGLQRYFWEEFWRGTQPHFKAIQHNLRIDRDWLCCLEGLSTVLLYKHVEKRVLKGGKEAFLLV